mgnify:CR=1 FL=1
MSGIGFEALALVKGCEGKDELIEKKIHLRNLVLVMREAVFISMVDL